MNHPDRAPHLRLVTDAPSDADRARALVAELRNLDHAFQDDGNGDDSYCLALGFVLGRHRLPTSYAAKLDELYWRDLRDRGGRR